MKLAIWILWPSFLVAAAANAIFFSVFDPTDLSASSAPATATMLAAYTVGFFAFWAIGACASAFTCFLQRDAQKLNRLACPFPNARRPPDCRSPESP